MIYSELTMNDALKVFQVQVRNLRHRDAKMPWHADEVYKGAPKADGRNEVRIIQQLQFTPLENLDWQKHLQIE